MNKKMSKKVIEFVVDNIGTITTIFTATAALATGGLWSFMIWKYDF